MKMIRFQLFRSFVMSILILAILGCSSPNKLTVEFLTAPDLAKGYQVYSSRLPIGYVYDIRPSKNLDTLFTILKINHKIRAPMGSQFYIDERLVGHPGLRLNFQKMRVT